MEQILEEKKETLYAGSCIRTVSGIYVDTLNPDPETINIEDIAHSLSRQCRFGGHLPLFYSVAQHSTWVARELIHSKELAFAGLMHDASEAYLMDIPTPIKSQLNNYKEIEDGLMKVISEKYGFEYPLSKHVKDADQMALELEWNEIMLNKNKDSIFYIMNPEEAKEDFINLFYLFKK